MPFLVKRIKISHRFLPLRPTFMMTKPQQNRNLTHRRQILQLFGEIQISGLQRHPYPPCKVHLLLKSTFHLLSVFFPNRPPRFQQRSHNFQVIPLRLMRFPISLIHRDGSLGRAPIPNPHIFQAAPKSISPLLPTLDRMTPATACRPQAKVPANPFHLFLEFLRGTFMPINLHQNFQKTRRHRKSGKIKCSFLRRQFLTNFPTIKIDDIHLVPLAILRARELNILIPEITMIKSRVMHLPHHPTDFHQ